MHVYLWQQSLVDGKGSFVCAREGQVNVLTSL